MCSSMIFFSIETLMSCLNTRVVEQFVHSRCSCGTFLPTARRANARIPGGVAGVAGVVGVVGVAGVAGADVTSAGAKRVGKRRCGGVALSVYPTACQRDGLQRRPR